MPYTMQIFPDEEESFPPPMAGDLFKVVDVDVVTDFHWGTCVHVVLVPLPKYQPDELCEIMKIEDEGWRSIAFEAWSKKHCLR